MKMPMADCGCALEDSPRMVNNRPMFEINEACEEHAKDLEE